MKKSIAIVDCAVKDPAIACFNRLQKSTDNVLSYHNFPMQGKRSLDLETKIDGLIVLGSHSNVGDGSSWHAPLSNYILEKLNNKIPVFAICFAHQLMAHTFGSTMQKNPMGKTLEGLRKIKLTQQIFGSSDDLFFFTAHNYQIKEVCDELQVLGTSEDSPFEVLAHKELPYWSCQSHPEGSDFFLENEISFQLSEKDRIQGLDSGLNFLKRFIEAV